MERGSRTALWAAGACFAGFVATGALTYASDMARARDAAALEGFATLQRQGLDGLMTRLVHFADPLPFLLFAIAVVAYAWFGGRRRTALVLGALLFLAPLTAEVVKHVLAHNRPGGVLTIGPVSWPSGHTTGAATLSLAATIAAPARLRPLIAALGLLFTIAMGYSVVTMVWHYPSDVLGALFLSAGGAFLAVAILRRWPDPVEAGEGRHGAAALAVVVVAATTAAGLVLLVGHEGPHRVFRHAEGHPSALVLAAAIAGLAALVVAGVAWVSSARS